MNINNKFDGNEFAKLDGIYYYGDETLGANGSEVTILLENRFNLDFADAAKFVNRER
jgi:hypothetical protein